MSRWLRKSHKKAGQIPGEMIYTGERRKQAVRVTMIDYTADTVREQEVKDLRDLKTAKDPHSITWVNVNGIHDLQIVDEVGEIFDLHDLLCSDVVNVHQRPKAEDYEHHIYVTLKMLVYNEKSQTVSDEHVSLIMGEHYVLSFQEEEGDVFEWVRERIRKGKGRIRSMRADYLMYSLLDAIVDGYFIVTERLGDDIEELEEEIMSNSSRQTLNDLNVLKREMIALRKAVLPLREAINWFIKSEHKLVRKKTVPYLKDLYDHTIQIHEIIESYRDMLGGLFDIYLSTISNRMNEIMKVLTIFAAIFIPLTFLAGVYGMNFENIPELHYRYGYFAVWLVMGCVAVGMLLWFKKKRWL